MADSLANLPQTSQTMRMANKLGVIVCSTRPGRGGLAVAQWIHDQAQKHGKFDVELVDLQEVNLPLLDEPKHPRLQQYQHAHTQAWAAKVKSLDALVFVTPEYNFNPPPALVNALDYLFLEWNYKAAGIVSYGGGSGGMRAAQSLKLLLTTVKVVPVTEAVAFTFYEKLRDAQGTFKGHEEHEKATTVMLNELVRWTDAIKPLRG